MIRKTDDMQILMNQIYVSDKSFGISISLGKIIAMLQHTAGNPFVKSATLIQETILKVIDKPVYLEGVFECSCALDEELFSRLQRATDSFSYIQSRVCVQHGITRRKNIVVYPISELKFLLYSCGNSSFYHSYVKFFDFFHQMSSC